MKGKKITVILLLILVIICIAVSAIIYANSKNYYLQIDSNRYNDIQIHRSFNNISVKQKTVKQAVDFINKIELDATNKTVPTIKSPEYTFDFYANDGTIDKIQIASGAENDNMYLRLIYDYKNDDNIEQYKIKNYNEFIQDMDVFLEGM